MSTDKKRDASSPIDAKFCKKARQSSIDSSLSETPGDSDQIPNFLTDEYAAKIATIVKEAIAAELTELTTKLVNKVTTGINETIQGFQAENRTLRDKIITLEKKVENLERQDAGLQQYSRKNCLRLSGIPESEGESVDQIATNLFQELGSNVSLKDADNMHRLKKRPNSQTATRPRDIIIKFISYRARQDVYAARSKL